MMDEAIAVANIGISMATDQMEKMMPGNYRMRREAKGSGGRLPNRTG